MYYDYFYTLSTPSTCPGGEMADTTALEAVAARHGGSSPLLGTRKSKILEEGFLFSRFSHE